MTVDEITKQTFIIAEVGSNFTNLEDCVQSVSQVKLAGADAVKFQLFDWKSMYGFGEPPESFRRSCLPKEWIPILKDKADKAGIKFMCTAFSPEFAKHVDRFVEVHKIASSDLNYLELLDAVSVFGKPVLASCGGHNASEINLALCHLSVPTILMHCVSSYPTRDANLGRIDFLRKTFEKPVGFSDHTTDITTIPMAAVHSHGAKVLEKHFKLRSNMETPDAPHSLTPDEFKRMVKSVRQPEIFNESYTWEENDMALMHNRRLVFISDLHPGDTLELNVNYGAFRVRSPDTTGLHCGLIEKLIGKKVSREIKAGEVVTIQDLESSQSLS